MLQYVLRRILFMIPTIVMVSIVVFFLIQLPPGSYVDYYVAELTAYGEDVTEDVLANLEARYGLNQPIYEQYWKWVSGFPRGDFGPSFLYFGESTWKIIRSYLAYTALIAFASEVFVLLVGIPVGIYSATHQYSFGDHAFTLVCFLGVSIPGFLLALVLMFVSYSVFHVSSVGGLFSDAYLDASWSVGKFIDLLKHLWLPVLVLGLSSTAGTIRRMRGNLLDVLNMQYIDTARAKGLGERIVVYKHAVRNAVAPIVMGVGMWFPALLSGSTIVSMVLSLPTLGPVLIRALSMQDMYLAGTILFFQCVLLLAGNLLADIALVWVDPRVEYD